jgi:regulator of cell morphogenesis and NO signaling
MNAVSLSPEAAIGALAIHFPSLIPFFEEKRIDYVLQGRRTLQEACLELGLDCSEVLEQLQSPCETEAAQRVWQRGEEEELIDHLLIRYHEGARESMDRLVPLLQQVQAGEGLPGEVVGKLEWVMQDMNQHMMKEERILFPYLRGMFGGSGGGPACFGSPEGPMRVMEMEHEQALGVLAEIRELCHGYVCVEGKESSLGRFMAELKTFHEDLLHHIHLENNLLFPSARARLRC